MVEGKIEIFLSYKEPEYRDNLLWLRPYLDREGYELLYYGANGWTRFIPCHPEPPLTPKGPIKPKPSSKCPSVKSLDSNSESTSTVKTPEVKPCRCPNQ